MKKYIITLSMALAFSTGTLAAESSQAQKGSQAVPSKESREQMAQAHDKMAMCLRSDVSVQDCHQQMREQCQDMKDDGGCMMGKMGRGMMKNFKKNAPTKDK